MKQGGLDLVMARLRRRRQVEHHRHPTPSGHFTRQTLFLHRLSGEQNPQPNLPFPIVVQIVDDNDRKLTRLTAG